MYHHQNGVSVSDLCSMLITFPFFQEKSASSLLLMQKENNKYKILSFFFSFWSWRKVLDNFFLARRYHFFHKSVVKFVVLIKQKLF